LTSQTSHRRQGGHTTFLRRALVPLLVTTLASPLGLAKTFTAFPNEEHFAQNASGNFYSEQLVTPNTGHVQVFAHGALAGTVEAVVRVGGTYVTNTGDIITPYNALVSTHGVLQGSINCVNFDGGTEGSLNLELQQWRLEGPVWVLKDVQPVRSWGCPLVSLVVDSFSVDRPMTFQPGSTYRVMLQVLARARSTDASQATVDFCESGTVRCGVSPESVQLQEITIPNKPPYARFNDQSFWYVDALEDGVDVTGRACEIDGTTVRITLRILGFGETTTSIGAVCGDGTHHFMPLVPGFYTGMAEGLDNEGGLGQDPGEVLVTIFPVGSLPPGFPDLSQFSPTSSFGIVTLLAPDESVLASRVTVDGVTISDGLTGLQPPVGSYLADIEYDLQAGQAAVTLDGLLRWSGLVVPVSDPVGWWDIRPL
jgi:hypothetical protein